MAGDTHASNTNNNSDHSDRPPAFLDLADSVRFMVSFFVKFAARAPRPFSAPSLIMSDAALPGCTT